MKRTLFIALLVVLACAAAPAQTTRTRGGATASGTTTAQRGDALEIASGTQLAAQLEQTLDVRKAHVGDRVVLKTTEAIKQNGQTVVKKGSRLVGRVTEVRQRAQGSAASSIGLVFDRLESGSLVTPITATITSVTQARAQTRAGDDNAGAMSDARTTSSARTSGGSSSGGGLLGGVTGTVGRVVDTTTNAAGTVVDTTTGAVGGVANGVGSTVSGLRITQSTSADVSGGSTLSLTGGSLRLEKNTTFHLVLNQSSSVNNYDRN
ncbi:MAG: hypothetical protein LC746_16260 [Acidobacteria bacterium]|nr:hypothetical protein [Acidobacteriota bacterium]